MSPITSFVGFFVSGMMGRFGNGTIKPKDYNFHPNVVMVLAMVLRLRVIALKIINFIETTRHWRVNAGP